MKLPFESYTIAWKNTFENLKEELELVLSSLSPQIEHIGSTSVEGLSAKPIIDIQIGVNTEADLNNVAEMLKLPSIVYYEKYNIEMPTRRFFVLFKKTILEMNVSSTIKLGEEIPAILQDHNLRTAHIHAFVVNSPDWIRHIAFRDFLRSNPVVKNQYQELKEKLIRQHWKDGNEYNEAKDDFLKKYEKIAVDWYLAQ